MKHEVKTEWVAALRSGKYEQGTGTLRTEHDQFCCLGVLCDLAVKHGIIPEPVLDRGDGVDVSFYYDDSQHYLPETVRAWAELGENEHDPDVEFEERHTSLASLNDERLSFEVIATVIEEQL